MTMSLAKTQARIQGIKEESNPAVARNMTFDLLKEFLVASETENFVWDGKDTDPGATIAKMIREGLNL